MDIQTILFENPMYGLITMAIVELVLVIFWHERRTRKTAWLLLGPPILAAAFFVLTAAVTTERERIFIATGEIASGIQNDRPEVLEEYLADNFRGVYQGGLVSKDMAMDKARMAIRAHFIKDIQLRQAKVEMFGKQASMEVPAIMQASEEGMSFRVKVLFRLTWIKTPKGWRLLEAKEPEVAQ